VKKQWEAMLSAYGQPLTLRRGGEETPLRAFLQPLRAQTPDPVPSPLGLAREGKYLYLGPAAEDLAGVTEVVLGDRAFRVLRHRPVWVGAQVLYRWAILEEWEEVAP
jgi:hypothetical protein